MMSVADRRSVRPPLDRNQGGATGRADLRSGLLEPSYEVVSEPGASEGADSHQSHKIARPVTSELGTR